MMPATLFALDFDGVICDSALETGLAGWQVARQIWPDMPEQPGHFSEQFRQVRPALETGFEAILIMRLLWLGRSASTLLADYNQQLQQLIEAESLNIAQLKQAFGNFRDQWIAEQPNDWLAMNPLFEGMANTLKSLQHATVYIITTKQERFVSQILAGNDLRFPEQRIFGLERQRSKADILQELEQHYPQHHIVFVEDRLPTLQGLTSIKTLRRVRLLLAKWGYNTPADRHLAQQSQDIELLADLGDLLPA